MATLSHEAFRRTVESFGGPDEYFTEMINASSLLNMGPFEKFYLLNGPNPEKIVWQLIGNSTASLEKAVFTVAEKGGIGIDINMGCSAPQIYKTGAGISWMLKPLKETEEAVCKIKRNIEEAERQTGKKIRLSVKCRLGDEDFTENSFFSFTDMLCASGVNLITLHPRTIKEKYRLKPKYIWCQKLAERCSSQNVKVYANGGVEDLQSLNIVKEECPLVSGIMISRAAGQKPWIFSELRGEHGSIDAEKLALDFIDNVELYQPKEFYKTRLQRFFSYYAKNFTFSHYFETQLVNAKDINESRERLKDYFVKQPSDKYINY